MVSWRSFGGITSEDRGFYVLKDECWQNQTRVIFENLGAFRNEVEGNLIFLWETCNIDFQNCKTRGVPKFTDFCGRFFVFQAQTVFLVEIFVKIVNNNKNFRGTTKDFWREDFFSDCLRCNTAIYVQMKSTDTNQPRSHHSKNICQLARFQVKHRKDLEIISNVNRILT